jgi:hypothetical protein
MGRGLIECQQFHPFLARPSHAFDVGEEQQGTFPEGPCLAATAWFGTTKEEKIAPLDRFTA